MNIFDTLKATKVRAFESKKHIVTLPYEDDFSEENIPTKSHLKELICWKIIDGMLIDLFQSIEETDTYYDAYWV
ncbi:hypothetical protein H5410_059890 [Solanum commersonii]|uniref:Uncharacterized protein n=1 Tax=Solanum commersonii TaxID=4109 RepID=A0A9J5W4C8_SOLCO|nr:hypothetical protein H5410_059890 [Solanum commersonii]